MKHYLTDDFYQKVLQKTQQGGEWTSIWQIILSDDTLSPLLRRDKIDVYYRGCKLFSLSENGIIRNSNEFNSSLVTYDIPKEIPAETFQDYLPYMKQSADLWLGAENNSIYDREFSQLILRENNSKKAGNHSDYFIIDMEHQYEPSGTKHDLIGLIMERGKRNSKKPVFRLSVIEVKYLDRAFDGPAGIRSHIDDYVNLTSNAFMLDELKQDTEEMFAQSKHLALFPGLLNKYDRITISGERPELLFALVSRDTNNCKNSREEKVESLKAILSDTSEKYGNLLDDVYIAGTAELGFGLYVDRKTKLKNYCDQLP